MPSSISKDEPAFRDHSSDEVEKEENLAGRADIEDEESDDEIYLRLQGEEVKNPLIGKRHNVFF